MKCNLFYDKFLNLFIFIVFFRNLKDKLQNRKYILSNTGSCIPAMPDS